MYILLSWLFFTNFWDKNVILYPKLRKDLFSLHLGEISVHNQLAAGRVARGGRQQFMGAENSITRAKREKQRQQRPVSVPFLYCIQANCPREDIALIPTIPAAFAPIIPALDHKLITDSRTLPQDCVRPCGDNLDTNHNNCHCSYILVC